MGTEQMCIILSQPPRMPSVKGKAELDDSREEKNGSFGTSGVTRVAEVHADVIQYKRVSRFQNILCNCVLYPYIHSLVPKRSVIGEKSTLYPLFAHAWLPRFLWGLLLCSGGSRGGSEGSMEPPFQGEPKNAFDQTEHPRQKSMLHV